MLARMFSVSVGKSISFVKLCYAPGVVGVACACTKSLTVQVCFTKDWTPKDANSKCTEKHICIKC